MTAPILEALFHDLARAALALALVPLAGATAGALIAAGLGRLAGVHDPTTALVCRIAATVAALALGWVWLGDHLVGAMRDALLVTASVIR